MNTTKIELDTVDDVFEAFKGPTAFGKPLGLKPSAASEMRRRGSIPSCYWIELVAAARSCGVKGLTLEKLARMHARRPAPGRARAA